MEDWKGQIGNCFGEVDQLFAIHPSDEQQAAKLLNTVRAQNVTWDEFDSAVRDHLTQRGCGSAHIDEQMVRVRKMFEPWLRD